MDYMTFQGSSNSCYLFLPEELNWGLNRFQHGLKCAGGRAAGGDCAGHELSGHAITCILCSRALSLVKLKTLTYGAHGWLSR